MKTIRFGVIGCGLMGREFASAAMRWGHLPAMDVRPEIVAICDTNQDLHAWYRAHLSSVRQVTDDYRVLLANEQVDSVYVAVPHHLHEAIYCAAIRAGKHLMGEKPFGIDRPANERIMQCLGEHPGVFARCSSEFPFYPALQRIGRMIDDAAFGQVIEIEAGFLHSSDLDPNKPINWKRMVEFNGDYGSMGDLGMHVCHVPFRAGWTPRTVRAILSNIVRQRPDGQGAVVPCETWDNATLLCDVVDPSSGEPFPMTLKTQRVAPGEKDTWYLKVLGTKACARFSTKNPKRLERLEYDGGEQIWGQIDMGHETAYPSITGGIFEFGFSDAILQMWAAFLHELEHGQLPSTFAGCVTPEETALSHRLFTAALQSQETASVVRVE
ncbi:MAG: Gfo/Idh/MocA family oxidoreductase [Pirellulales bacterium]|nr:Gfo/Idh/MocA family oxidoreductase [Pirellulales bacterium]